VCQGLGKRIYAHPLIVGDSLELPAEKVDTSREIASSYYLRPLRRTKQRTIPKQERGVPSPSMWGGGGTPKKRGIPHVNGESWGAHRGENRNLPTCTGWVVAKSTDTPKEPWKKTSRRRP